MTAINTDGHVDPAPLSPQADLPHRFLLTNQTKSELVYQQIREMIVNSRLYPGEHLYLREIAAQLGVSTNPIREALRRLESEGLVTSHPHAGTVVASIDLEKIEVHFLIRGALEGVAVFLAAAHLSTESLVELKQRDQELDELAVAGDYVTWNEKNIAFYRFLFDCARSPELVAMIELQRDRSPRFHHFQEALIQRANESDLARRDLLAALAAGDHGAAERLHRQSVARTGQLLCAAMRKARENRTETVVRIRKGVGAPIDHR